MAQLWRAGVRGGALTAVAAWKDVLLRRRARARRAGAPRRLPFDGTLADWLALAFGALVVALRAAAAVVARRRRDAQGRALRRAPRPAPGRGVLPRARARADRRASAPRLCRTVLATAAFVAAFGLVDVYAVPLSWWRARRPAGSTTSSGSTTAGLSGLPENFVYNAGGGVVFRRLTSTFLSPLATAYLLVVALFFVPLRRRWGPPVALLLFAALLWTHTRSALLALVARPARARASCAARAAAGAARVVVAVVGARLRQGVRPLRAARRTSRRPSCASRSRTRSEHPAASNDATSANEASTSEHLASVARRACARSLHHPWGFGLGNAGVTAARTHVTVQAGESTYTELGVETGLRRRLVFVAWSLALLRATLRCAPWLGAAFAAVLFLGLQTDVIGVPWIAVTVWASRPACSA